MDEEMESYKWTEAGTDHRYWRRNWAVYRMRHVQNRDERFPRPLENHIFSLIETVRPIFSDNVPNIEIVSLFPGLEDQQAKLNAMWRWVSHQTSFDSFWASLYDYYPQTGLTAGKVMWDATAPRGGKPVLSHIDPRSVATDPLARINHRDAEVIRLKHKVNVGELKELFPEMADKISAVSTEYGGRSGGLSDLSNSRDTGYDMYHGSHVEDRVAEVVEMWIKPNNHIEALSETEVNQPDEESLSQFSSEEPWLVYTYIPNAGVISREIALNGLQIGTAQAWRNPDNIYGISDVEMVVGMQIAMDQLNIRGHAHRLAVFAPPLLLPRDSGVNRDSVSGRAAPIWEPSTSQTSQGIGWLNVPGPNPEALNYLAERPQAMRRILGIDEITPQILERTQTATAVSEVREALEARTRQKIRNLNDMIVDLCRSAISLTLQNIPVSVFAPGQEGFTEITPEEMEQIDLSNFAVKLATDKTGPLTKQGQLAALRQTIELGTFDPESPLPLEAREMIIDASSVPNGEVLKQRLRQQEEEKQQAIAQAQAQEQAMMEQQMAMQEQAMAAQAPAPEETEAELTDEELQEIINA
jgi:hypothetical protein